MNRGHVNQDNTLSRKKVSGSGEENPQSVDDSDCNVQYRLFAGNKSKTINQIKLKIPFACNSTKQGEREAERKSGSAP